MCPGAAVQDIAMTVQAYVELLGFSMVRAESATGHPIRQIHADGWHVLYDYSEKNKGQTLQEGMSITVKPFIYAGETEAIRLPNVTKSAVMTDRSLAGYWEPIVVVTKSGREVLDLRDDKDVTFYNTNSRMKQVQRCVTRTREW